MSSVTLKKQVVEKLLATENDYLLQEINRLIELEEQGEEVLVLNETQKEKINTSLLQINKGEFFSDEDLNSKIEKWLNE